jgi:hypothetical protein
VHLDELSLDTARGDVSRFRLSLGSPLASVNATVCIENLDSDVVVMKFAKDRV